MYPGLLCVFVSGHLEFRGRMIHFIAIRFAEFSKACVERSLQNKVPPVTYYGFFRDDVKHRKVAGDLESTVFSHWDQSSQAPAKLRPRPPVSLPWMAFA